MFKRMMALLLMMLLPVLASAEDFVPYEVFTFSAQLPETLRAPLSAHVPDASDVLSGAAIRHNGSEYSTYSYSALLLLDTSEGPRLLAAAQPEGLPWQINDFTHLLRSQRSVSVSIYKDEFSDAPLFSVDYAEANGVVSDLVTFYQLWQMTGHTDTGADVTITAKSGSIELTDSQGWLECQSAEGFWLDYMQDISAFPTSREEALALEARAESAYIATSLKAIMYAGGAHLRKGPTGSADSLGQYNNDVPMVFLGKQEKGAYFPWYQVRIGSTEGWMSSNYVSNQPSQHFPVPVGRTVDGCALYTALGDKQPAQQLAPGTTFHILTETDGMYHICIPQGDISWAVDVDGVYGYISAKGILTGASVSALDALEAAR